MYLQVLTPEQLDQIHQATLAMLSQTGVELTHAGARELLQANGATVAGSRVLLPAELVEKCLALCPAQVRMQGRATEKGVDLGTGGCFPHNVGGVPNVLEKETRRPALRQDVIQATRLLDALPSVASITPHFTPQDVPAEQLALWMFYDAVVNTTKPLRAPGTHEAAHVQQIAEMADIAFPDLGRRGLSISISPISPLTFPDNIAEAMMEAARQQLIFGPLPCPIAGATAPMSIIGAVAQQNAEVLASIVLAQLVRPGTSIVYKGRISLMDPRSGQSLWGAPELGLISAATVQTAHHYRLPVDVYGFSTGSHLHDFQNGYERLSSALLPVLAGADEISGVGEMDSGVNSSLAQMVLDDELFAGISRIGRGVRVDADALGVELVAEVIGGPGNFLAENHTVRYLRSGEMLFTELADHSGWSEWEAAGCPSILDRAEAKAAKLLAQAENAGESLGAQEMAELQKLIR